MPELTQATQGEDMSFQVWKHCCLVSRADLPPCHVPALVMDPAAASVLTALSKLVQQFHTAQIHACKHGTWQPSLCCLKSKETISGRLLCLIRHLVVASKDKDNFILDWLPDMSAEGGSL